MGYTKDRMIRKSEDLDLDFTEENFEKISDAIIEEDCRIYENYKDKLLCN